MSPLRNRYLVCYDIRDPDRLRIVRRTMLGFGEPLQYSVFLCELSGKEKVLLNAAVSGVIDHAADRVLIVDLGPSGGRGDECIEFLGTREDLPSRDSIVV